MVLVLLLVLVLVLSLAVGAYSTLLYCARLSCSAPLAMLRLARRSAGHAVRSGASCPDQYNRHVHLVVWATHACPDMVCAAAAHWNLRHSGRAQLQCSTGLVPPRLVTTV